MGNKKNIGGGLLVGALVLQTGFLSWWVLLGPGKIQSSRIGMVENRLDSLIKRDGGDGSLGDEIIVNKAAAEAIKNLKPELEAMQAKAEEPPTPTPTPAVLGAADNLREYFIPLGSGSTTKQEWADVSSLQATINGDRYGEIVSVHFEGSIRSVNGVVEARLLDRTSSSVIHESNITYGGSSFTWTSSKPFTVPAGGRTYIVQMRSSSGEMVEMNGGRLRIVSREQ